MRRAHNLSHPLRSEHNTNPSTLSSSRPQAEGSPKAAIQPGDSSHPRRMTGGSGVTNVVDWLNVIDISHLSSLREAL